MKRSEINREIRAAEDFFALHNFKLPKFASWNASDWAAQDKDEIAEIFDCNLGWDITDFGRGDFRKYGLMLFTIRNGVTGSELYPKKYAEKIMISRSNQITLMHCHVLKTEDIINRGGGRLVFELFNRKGNTGAELDDTPVTVSRDGEELILQPGERLILEPGESILLEQNVFHRFFAEEGADVMIGEVSAVNDDHNDNVFYGEQQRFPTIIEDEEPYRYLVSDYANL